MEQTIKIIEVLCVLSRLISHICRIIPKKKRKTKTDSKEGRITTILQCHYSNYTRRNPTMHRRKSSSCPKICKGNNVLSLYLINNNFDYLNTDSNNKWDAKKLIVFYKYMNHSLYVENMLPIANKDRINIHYLWIPTAKKYFL